MIQSPTIISLNFGLQVTEKMSKKHLILNFLLSMTELQKTFSFKTQTILATRNSKMKLLRSLRRRKNSPHRIKTYLRISNSMQTAQRYRLMTSPLLSAIEKSIRKSNSMPRKPFLRKMSRKIGVNRIIVVNPAPADTGQTATVCCKKSILKIKS